MVSIAKALGRIKDDLPRLIDRRRIATHCRQLSHRWREGPLNPAVTVQLFLLQILNCNTAINHLRHLTKITFTASAFCQARARLPLALLERLMSTISDALIEETRDVGRWLGHRVWHIDGSTFSMPDEPELQTRFGQPGAQAVGCGFPLASLMVRCDAATGLIAKAIALPFRVHEMAHIESLHEDLRPGDVLVGDRGYCSYVHLALVLRVKLDAVFRIHQRTIVSFKRGRRRAKQYSKTQRAGKPSSQWIKSLGSNDQVVRWFKPTSKPKWCDKKLLASLPDSIELRELRYRVDRLGFRSKEITLVTTLLDGDAYLKKELAKLYQQRWRIETRLRELKITLGLDVLKCKTVAGVLKELAVFVLVYNLVRRVCLEAARRQGVEPDRISFIDALRWLRGAPNLETCAQLIVNPDRNGRHQLRVIKRRAKPYKLMQKPRSILMEELMGQSVGT